MSARLNCVPSWMATWGAKTAKPSLLWGTPLGSQKLQAYMMSA